MAGALSSYGNGAYGAHEGRAKSQYFHVHIEGDTFETSESSEKPKNYGSALETLNKIEQIMKGNLRDKDGSLVNEKVCDDLIKKSDTILAGYNIKNADYERKKSKHWFIDFFAKLFIRFSSVNKESDVRSTHERIKSHDVENVIRNVDNMVIKSINEDAVDDKVIAKLTPERKNRLLVLAAETGLEKVVTFLLRNNGIDANTVDAEGNPVLHLAIINGHVDVVQSLLEKGANPNVENNDVSALRFAFFCDNSTKPINETDRKNILKLLLENEADPYLKCHSAEPKYFNCLLYTAIENAIEDANDGREEDTGIVKLLLDKKHDIKDAGPYAVRLCVKEYQKKEPSQRVIQSIVTLLLERGINLYQSYLCYVNLFDSSSYGYATADDIAAIGELSENATKNLETAKLSQT
jgi:hypothetical protein